jgi:hypothetical protein
MMTSASAASNISPPKPERKEGRFTSSFRSMFGNKDAANLHNNSINLNNQLSHIPHKPSIISSSTPEQYFHPSSSDIQRETDLFGFIEKQGEYIAQLEKETTYSRDELSTMLGKVREVIAENEALHDKQKKDLLSNMIQHLNEKTDGYGMESPGRSGYGTATPTPTSAKPKPIGGGGGSSNIIMESRVAELDAQLGQARRSLRIAQQEILELRKGKLEDMTSGGSGASGNKDGDSLAALNNNFYANCDLHRTEIETLVR